MIMCVLLCYPVSIHMSQVQATGRPISSYRIVEHLKFVYIRRVGDVTRPYGYTCHR